MPRAIGHAALAAVAGFGDIVPIGWTVRAGISRWLAGRSAKCRRGNIPPRRGATAHGRPSIEAPSAAATGAIITIMTGPEEADAW